MPLPLMQQPYALPIAVCFLLAGCASDTVEQEGPIGYTMLYTMYDEDDYLLRAPPSYKSPGPASDLAGLAGAPLFGFSVDSLAWSDRHLVAGGKGNGVYAWFVSSAADSSKPVQMTRGEAAAFADSVGVQFIPAEQAWKRLADE